MDSDNVRRIPWFGPHPTRLSDDDEYRRDTLDLDASRRAYGQPDTPTSPCCEHCRGDYRDPRARLMGEAGRYLDLYFRSGVPTKALTFALICWGLSYLVATARFVYDWALEVWALTHRAGPVLPFGGPL